MMDPQPIPDTLICLPDIPDEEMPQCPMVLVCEDDPQIRSLLARVLHKNGYIVLATDSTDTALHLTRIFYDWLKVLITDIRLPGPCDGVALCQQCKSLAPNLGIIAISGRSTDQVVGQLAVPGVAILQKPFAVPDLLALLSTLGTTDKAL